jgi:ABC-type polysaccharide/polyol phosphate transport system ATPase subunit
MPAWKPGSDPRYTPPVSASPAVSLDGVSKRFFIDRYRAGGLKDRILDLARGRRHEREELWALRGVSLDIARGETLAVVGPNGCGKSTLLQVVAGILEPDGGTAAIHGRVTSLLELGAGFSPDLSGRENIYLNASLHGLSRRDVAPRFDAIVDFAELERFIDMPVRNYSSGMYMRLGIAVAVHLDPEIVLIDEAFAVGDEAFQRKCLHKLREFQQQGITIVLVSHDPLLVERTAHRACLLQKGHLVHEGPAAETLAVYHQMASAQGFVPGEHRWGSREIVITRVETRNGDDEATQVFRTGQPMTVALGYSAARRVTTPVFGLALYHEGGTHLTGPNTRMSRFPIDTVEGEGEVRYHVASLPLLPGRYVLSVSAYDHDLAEAYDHRERVATITVVEGGTLERFGIMTLNGSWDLSADRPRQAVEREHP